MAVTVFTVAPIVWYAAHQSSKAVLGYQTEALRMAAIMTSDRLESRLRDSESSSLVDVTLASFCRQAASTAEARVTVILPEGEVVCDSLEDPSFLGNQSGLPDVRRALQGERGTHHRSNPVTGQDFLAVAVPLDTSLGRGAVRLTRPLDTVISAGYRRVWLVSTLLVFLSVAMILVITRRLLSPLKEMKRGAERFARGDLDVRLPVARWEETGSLAEEMNRMASHLDDRIRTVIRQRNEMEAVLGSMAEGVLAVDMDERVLSMNSAAATLLGTSQGNIKGKSVCEVVRNPSLQDFIAETLAGRGRVEGEITIRDRGEQFLQAHGSVLTDAAGHAIGGLLVLNDVTRLRKLEKIRRDFVANASHEIRTPVTTIKGFVETILDGALDDRKTTERFLRIVASHADRLNAIVEDLLSLSKIEREVERGETSLMEAPLREVVEEAVEVCLPEAQKKDIQLNVECGEKLTALINPSLLIQAVTNLVTNAVKYSDPGKEVDILCFRREGGMALAVRDSGPGIASEHLPRLFERFYRADKARSRTLGGTGLGLAIVKHIASVHGGEVKVESRIGEGSTFTIHLSRTRDGAEQELLTAS
jgi:two-component system phosphate regulon sensor histidine kinase PhoR